MHGRSFKREIITTRIHPISYETSRYTEGSEGYNSGRRLEIMPVPVLQVGIRAFKNPFCALARRTYSTDKTYVIRKIDSNLELITRHTQQGQTIQEKPILLLFSWMLAKRKHIKKYETLYLDRGFNVLTIQAKPLEILQPKKAQKIASNIVDCLNNNDFLIHQQPFCIHGFSVGGYLSSEFLTLLNSPEARCRSPSKRFQGQIFDSPVDTDGIPSGFSAVLTKNPFVRRFLKTSLQFFLNNFKQTVQHYQNASKVFKANQLGVPTLFLYSKADRVISVETIEKVIKDMTDRGLPVSQMYWFDSEHVSHFHQYPEEYVKTIDLFLEKLNFKNLKR